MTLMEASWLNADEFCTMEHVLKVSGLPRALLESLMEAGLIEAGERQGAHIMFHTECIVQARQARRLHDDFELNAEGLTLAMSLLRRIDRLQEQLDALHARMPRSEGK